MLEHRDVLAAAAIGLDQVHDFNERGLLGKFDLCAFKEGFRRGCQDLVADFNAVEDFAHFVHLPARGHRCGNRPVAGNPEDNRLMVPLNNGGSRDRGHRLLSASVIRRSKNATLALISGRTLGLSASKATLTMTDALLRSAVGTIMCTWPGKRSVGRASS